VIEIARILSRFAEGAPEFPSVLREYTKVQAATQSDSDVLLKRFIGSDVVLVADVHRDFLLRKAIGWLLGTKEIVDEDGAAYHFCQRRD